MVLFEIIESIYASDNMLQRAILILLQICSINQYFSISQYERKRDFNDKKLIIGYLGLILIGIFVIDRWSVLALPYTLASFLFTCRQFEINQSQRMKAWGGYWGRFVITAVIMILLTPYFSYLSMIWAVLLTEGSIWGMTIRLRKMDGIKRVFIIGSTIIAGYISIVILIIGTDAISELLKKLIFYVIMGSIIIIALLAEIMVLYMEEDEKKILTEKKVRFQKEQLRLNELYEQETKNVAAGLRTGIRQVQAAIAADAPETACTVLSDALEQTRKESGIRYTGNLVADSLLFTLEQQCRQAGITLETTFAVEQQVEVSMVDLAIILGNLFENAVEANQGHGEKRIIVKIYTNENSLVIEVANTVHKVKKRLPGKRKKLGMNRGYGRSNIACSVEKNGGLLRVREGKLYETQIRLPGS